MTFTFKTRHAAADISGCIEVTKVSFEIRFDVHRKFLEQLRTVEGRVGQLEAEGHVHARVIQALGNILLGQTVLLTRVNNRTFFVLQKYSRFENGFALPDRSSSPHIHRSKRMRSR